MNLDHTGLAQRLIAMNDEPVPEGQDPEVTAEERLRAMAEAIMDSVAEQLTGKPVGPGTFTTAQGPVTGQGELL